MPEKVIKWLKTSSKEAKFIQLDQMSTLLQIHEIKLMLLLMNDSLE